VTALLYGRLFLLTTLVALAACFLWVQYRASDRSRFGR
jgi:hypothetical protein